MQRKPGILFGILVAAATIEVSAAVANAQVTAGCGAVPDKLVHAEGDPGAISLSLGYGNDSSNPVTFTTTVTDDVFSPSGSSTITVAPGTGVSQQPALQLSFFPVGSNVVRYEITSDATGDTVLGSCEYDLTVVDTGPGDGAGTDTDGDALPDAWETGGITYPDGSTVALPGADPMRKDLFLELDCLEVDANGNGTLDPGDHTHCPIQGAVSDVVQAFANAPIANVDGTTGVQLHVDVGPLYGTGVVTTVNGTGGVVGTYGDLGGGNRIAEAGNEIIDFDGAAGDPGTSIYDLKAANFDRNRVVAFRYGIFGHQTNGRRAANDCTSGWAEGIPGNDFFVTLGGDDSSGAACWGESRAQQAGTLMHEFGHVLGHGHGGGDGVNRKPNYLSVMSYAFQMCTVPASATGGLPGGCDYSQLDGSEIPDLDQTNLDECLGIAGGLGFGPMDWDGDSTLEGVSGCTPGSLANVTADVNGDGKCVKPGANGTLDTTPVGDDVIVGSEVRNGPDLTCDTTAAGDDEQARTVGTSEANPLISFDDWSAIDYNYRTASVYPEGISSPVEEEADPDTIEEARRELAAQTEAIVEMMAGAPAAALPGETVVYDVDLGNTGTGPALEVVLSVTLPDGSTDSADVGTLRAGDATSFEFEYTVPANACPDDLEATFTATWKDFAGQPGNTMATAVTQVIDGTPPILDVAADPAVLWPANHRMVPVDVLVGVVDECDPDPAVTLLAITSNEPFDALGDGRTSPDVAGAEIGTDDRSFELRAERDGRNHGRTYTIVYGASDASGNVTTAETFVEVPRDRR